MRALLKHGVIVLLPEDDDDADAFAAWRTAADGHVFAVHAQERGGTVLHDLGPRDEACRVPLNVSYRVADPGLRLISNFAATPFTLDGRTYVSVEGFWQGLKFPSDADRRRLALLAGGEAKRAGEAAPSAEAFMYEGERILFGTHGHWRLMQRACWAKFTQDVEAQAALLATAPRPLTHVVRHDSKTIPGALMADIWMRLRKRLQRGDHLRWRGGEPAGADLLESDADGDNDGEEIPGEIPG